jgi:hypothetical protein
MSEPTGEKRDFRVHPKFLADAIRRQAGTLSKAVLEAVMNATDAGANIIRITTDADGRQIVMDDDGRGFQSRQEIHTWFECFGQPHEESEQKVYGTFRMGRGQLFNFGVNRWRTGDWTMVVDLDKHGLCYVLEDESTTHKGCRIQIDFYRRLTASDQYQLHRDLSLWCKYALIDVIYNGKSLSTPAAQQKWDRETPEAYIRLKATGGLRIYNLGIYVQEKPAHTFGAAGKS